MEKKTTGAAAGTSQAGRNREEMIAVAAYFRAERRGFAPGEAHDDWLAAAAEIDRQLQADDTARETAAKAKQKFQRQLAAQLKDWDARLAQWSEQAARAKSKTRGEYEKQLEALTAQRADAEKKLRQLRAHSVDAWEDVKEGAESVWQEMRKTMERVAARFK